MQISIELTMNAAKLGSRIIFTASRPRSWPNEGFVPFAGGGVCGSVKA